VQFERRHRRVGRLEGLLKGMIDMQRPVEEVRVPAVLPRLLHTVHSRGECLCDRCGVVNDDSVAGLSLRAKRRADKGMESVEVALAASRSGEHEGQLDGFVLGMQQDAEQIENLLGCSYAARENDNPVCDTNECLEALLHVRQDHQLVDYGIGRFRGNDRRLREAQVSAALESLFGMAEGGALHWALHRTCAAAGADVEFVQTESVTHRLRIVVLETADRMASPANDDARRNMGAKHLSVAKNVEYGIGNSPRRTQIETIAREYGLVRIEQVAKDGKQVLLDPANHLPVDERRRRRVLKFKCDPAFLAHDGHCETFVTAQNLADIVFFRTGVQHRQRTLAPQVV
jgi:hypothetical protein